MTSLWADGFPTPQRPPLGGDVDVDVAIVGAGYTGLWTAWYLLRRDPHLRLLVVDAHHVGFGGSGRNGGWCSALLPMRTDARLHAAMVATIDEVDRATREMGIDCHFAKGGSITVALNDAQARRLRAGIGARERWLDAAAAGEVVQIPGTVGGVFTPDCAALHPGRLVHGLAAAVEGAGGTVHEATPATSIAPRRVTTEHGTIRAEVVVRATEAWTARLRGTRRAVAPIYSLMIATEPLPAAVLDEIGLARRETFTDGRRLVIYGQRTVDDRIAFGGRGAPYHYASAIEPRFDSHERVHDSLHRTLVELFPALREARITHRWGGPVAAPRDWHASVRFDRATGLASAGGYVGDGVAASNLAARTLADLVTGEDSELTSLGWVGHTSRAWEPEPLRWIGINTVVRLPSSIDRAEAGGRSARWRSRLLDRLTAS